MKESAITQFNYLGERNYVAGTTITNGLMDMILEWGLINVVRINCVFNFPLKSQARYRLLEEKEMINYSPKSYPAMFTLSIHNCNLFVFLIPSQKPIYNRIDYDEELLTSNCVFNLEKREISSYLNSSLPLINTIVALNKRMLLRLLPTEGFGQWFLGRFELSNNFLAAQRDGLLKLKLNATIGETTTRTIIEFCDQHIGTIFFSRGKLR